MDADALLGAFMQGAIFQTECDGSSVDQFFGPIGAPAICACIVCCVMLLLLSDLGSANIARFNCLKWL